MSTNIDNLKSHDVIYGPVPSRRLGRSLGVDLVTYKTCSYDCIYCQLGRTTNKTIKRKEYVPVDVIIDQLKNKLNSKPDYITLSGSGEPTLFSKLEELIRKIHEISNVPVAVLTNGSLLWMPEVRQSLMLADLVAPSLDAGTEALFNYINRPCPEIKFNAMLEDLVKFRQEYAGIYWLEVFLLSGLTTVEVQVNALSNCISKIDPDKVQLNTATRPPSEDFALPVPQDQLKDIAKRLYGNVEIIAEYKYDREVRDFAVHAEDILSLLKRRPCSTEDIAAGLGLHINEVVKYIERLTLAEKIETDVRNQKLYYIAKL
jgi:wyosine [tRNA(Phe)-imidazoG37] synthetase (radical SAM superfamily)